MLNYLGSSVYALTVPLILLSLLSNLLCKIAKNPTLLPVDLTLLPVGLKNARVCQLSDMRHTH